MATLSLIIPVFNEEDSIQQFATKMASTRQQILDALGEGAALEFLFVNDGSVDGTRSIIERLCEGNGEFRLINLSRNFGKEAALSAGLHFATGDAVVPIDVDLQDPPEIIVEMIAKWKAGSHVVNAKRIDRSGDDLIKRSTAGLFYWLIRKMSDHPVHEHVGDFRLLDRQAVNALNELSERSRFNKGLFSWIGFSVTEVEYVRPTRQHGTTKWNMLKLSALAADGITSSTTLPLRIWTYIGVLIAFTAFVYASVLIVYTLVTGGDTPGYASVMVAVLMLGGLNLVSLGLIGEYLGRVAVEVRGRPLYIVESTRGF